MTPPLKVASLAEGRDCRLVVVSPTIDRYLPAPEAFPTLQDALDDWQTAAPVLAQLYTQLAQDPAAGVPLDVTALAAPLPRAYHWAEASTYLSHMRRIRAARGVPMPADPSRHVLYQSGSTGNLPPVGRAPLAEPDLGLDLEATVAVITDDVPQGTPVDRAGAHVALVTLVNDLTLRHVMPLEYANGIGPYQAKPNRPYAPVAASPAALGAAWDPDAGVLAAQLRVRVNGEELGRLDTASGMSAGFTEIIAFATRTRPLEAGSVIGSGTVSNEDPAHGYGCLAERAAVEGRFDDATYLQVGDVVEIEAFDADGRSVFGAITTTIVAPDQAA